MQTKDINYMELTLEQALKKGVEAHNTGNVEEASKYYTAILRADPKHPDANHNMGVLAFSAGNIKDALTFFKTATDANPKISQFWVSYIDTLIKLRKVNEAKIMLIQAKEHVKQNDRFNDIEKKLMGDKTANNKLVDPHEQLLVP